MDLTFEIAEKRIEDFSVETVTGGFDGATTPGIQGQSVAQEAAGALVIAVDLAGAPFIDSAILGGPVGAYRRQQGPGGCLQRVATEPRILKVPEITDLSNVFPVFAAIGEVVHG